jgi:hypothetical protein
MTNQTVFIEKSRNLPLIITHGPSSPIEDLTREDDEIVIDQSVGYANSWEAPAGKVILLKTDIPELIRVLKEIQEKV